MHTMLLQSCLTRHDPMNCSSPGHPVHEIFQARKVWVAMPSSRGSSCLKDQICVSDIKSVFQISNLTCFGRQAVYHHAT